MPGTCGLTFELSRPWRQTPAGRGRTIYTMAWSGQTVAAVAGRRLERGVRPQLHSGQSVNSCKALDTCCANTRGIIGSTEFQGSLLPPGDQQGGCAPPQPGCVEQHGHSAQVPTCQQDREAKRRDCRGPVRPRDPVPLVRQIRIWAEARSARMAITYGHQVEPEDGDSDDKCDCQWAHCVQNRLTAARPLRPNVRAKRTVEADAGWPRKDDFYHGLERPDGGRRSGSALERGVRRHSRRALR